MNDNKENETEVKPLARFFGPLFTSLQNAGIDTIGALGAETRQRQNIRNAMYYGGIFIAASLILKN